MSRYDMDAIRKAVKSKCLYEKRGREFRITIAEMNDADLGQLACKIARLETLESAMQAMYDSFGEVDQ